MTHLRDEALDAAETLLSGTSKAPAHAALQAGLAQLSAEARGLVQRVVLEAVDAGVHGLLFALQESSDDEGPVRLTVEGTDVATLSDGLHGELFTEDGWQAKFSRYGEGDE